MTMDSLPASVRSSRANSALQISQSSSPAVSPNTSAFRGSQLSSEVQINQQPQYFNVDDFKFDTVLGQGRSKVYLANYESSRIALKVAE